MRSRPRPRYSRTIVCWSSCRCRRKRLPRRVTCWWSRNEWARAIFWTLSRTRCVTCWRRAESCHRAEEWAGSNRFQNSKQQRTQQQPNRLPSPFSRHTFFWRESAWNSRAKEKALAGGIQVDRGQASRGLAEIDQRSDVGCQRGKAGCAIPTHRFAVRRADCAGEALARTRMFRRLLQSSTAGLTEIPLRSRPGQMS